MLNEKLLSEAISGAAKKANDYKALGILTSRDLELIVAGLNLIKKDFEAGVDFEVSEDTDIHGFVQRLLIDRIGQAAMKLDACVA